mmetsp:Transcript_14920/g.41108  ORF Transcript_14920/g.41108 Transcript_14920/m.41108 type:complete len:90 (-) Transcript_14920:169-438(-)
MVDEWVRRESLPPSLRKTMRREWRSNLLLKMRLKKPAACEPLQEAACVSNIAWSLIRRLSFDARGGTCQKCGASPRHSVFAVRRRRDND